MYIYVRLRTKLFLTNECMANGDIMANTEKTRTEKIWTGRTDPEDGDQAKRWHQIVRFRDEPGGGYEQEDSGALAALIGFASDEGVIRNKGRAGAKNGPLALRQALSNLAWHGPEGYVRDLGDLSLPPIQPDSSGSVQPNSPQADPLLVGQQHLAQRVTAALGTIGKVLVLGGGHETAAGSFQGLLNWLEQKPAQKIGIVNLDAHFDLRHPGEAGISSGTAFFQIRELLSERGLSLNYMCLGIANTANTHALFDRSDNWGVSYLRDSEITPARLEQAFSQLDAFLSSLDVLYLSLDLDVLPYWQMPAVSAPATRGVDLGFLEEIIDYIGTKTCTDGILWPLSDVVEFNPGLDPDGNAARLAARLCDRILRNMLSNTPENPWI